MIQPPMGGYGLTSLAVVEPLGLECIAGGLEDIYKIDLLDMRFDKNLERALIRFDPDVVAVTASTTEVKNAHSILKKVRELKPHSLTVVGGFHPTLRPRDLEADYIDAVVRGEGESTFRECLKAYVEGKTFKGIPGMSYYDRSNERLVHNADRPQIEDLDELHHPYRKPVEKHRRKYNLIFWQPLTSLETARGCPYRCTFCVVWKIYHGTYRVKSPKRVVEELETIKEKHILIVDDNFLQDVKRVEKICGEILQRGIKKKFGIGARADSMARNPGIVKQLADAGLGFAVVGFEALTNSQLLAIRKRATVEENEIAIKLLHDHGVKIWGTFVVDSNFTKEDFKALLDYVVRHDIEFPQYTVLTPLPGSDLFDEKRDELMTFDWEHYDTLRTVLPTKLPLHVFNREMEKLYRGSYLAPKRLLRRLFNLDYPFWKFPGFLKLLNSLRTYKL